MGRLAVIGTPLSVAGFRLVGALVVEAEEPHEVRAAWSALPADVAVVVLTPDAARAVADAPGSPASTGSPAPLRVVLPW